MIITINEGYNKNSYLVKCQNPDFIKKIGSKQIDTSDLFKTMKEISEFVNNVFKDECLFEIG